MYMKRAFVIVTPIFLIRSCAAMDSLAEFIESNQKKSARELVANEGSKKIVGATQTKPIAIPVVASSLINTKVFGTEKLTSPIQFSPPSPTLLSPSLSPPLMYGSLRSSPSSSTGDSGSNEFTNDYWRQKITVEVDQKKKMGSLKKLQELIADVRGFRNSAQKALENDPNNEKLAEEIVRWEKRLQVYAAQVLELIKP